MGMRVKRIEVDWDIDTMKGVITNPLSVSGRPQSSACHTPLEEFAKLTQLLAILSFARLHRAVDYARRWYN